MTPLSEELPTGPAGRAQVTRRRFFTCFPEQCAEPMTVCCQDRHYHRTRKVFFAASADPVQSALLQMMNYRFHRRMLILLLFGNAHPTFLWLRSRERGVHEIETILILDRFFKPGQGNTQVHQQELVWTHFSLKSQTELTSPFAETRRIGGISL